MPDISYAEKPSLEDASGAIRYDSVSVRLKKVKSFYCYGLRGMRWDLLWG